MTDLDGMVMPVDARPVREAAAEGARALAIPMLGRCAWRLAGHDSVGVPVDLVRVEMRGGALTLLPGVRLSALAWLGRAFGSAESHG